ncbi:hypothetical protein JCM16138_16770 [Thermococcus atlanticus]
MSHRRYERILRKAEKSLLAAKKLLEENLPEFAVSRAYYTMSYCLEALLRTKGIEVSKHSSAIALFGRDFVRSGEVPRKYLTYINLAFRTRQVADYSFELEISKEEAAEEIRRAGEFLEFTRRYLSSRGFMEG